jgi:hypothetical protein
LDSFPDIKTTTLKFCYSDVSGLFEPEGYWLLCKEEQHHYNG